MSESDASPQAVIHKRILDTAKANPETSIEALAEEVAGASPDLVERVLDTYGDPADEQSSQVDGQESEAYDSVREVTTMSDAASISLGDLSDEQREVLQAIHRRPDATQRELAEQLGVSAATISKRVNEIDGFSWEDRREFVDDVIDGDGTASDGGTARNGELEDRLATLQERLDELEARVEGTTDLPPLADPELLAKVVRACIAEETISKEEEIAILKALLSHGMSTKMDGR